MRYSAPDKGERGLLGLVGNVEKNIKKEKEEEDEADNYYILNWRCYREKINQRLNELFEDENSTNHVTIAVQTILFFIIFSTYPPPPSPSLLFSLNFLVNAHTFPSSSLQSTRQIYFLYRGWGILTSFGTHGSCGVKQVADILITRVRLSGKPYQINSSAGGREDRSFAQGSNSTGGDGKRRR